MKQGLKTFGLLLLAALSLTAVMAAGAQAADEIEVKGTAGPLKTLMQIAGNAGPGELLVPGLGLTIDCSSAKITGSVKNTGTGGVTGTAHILYHGCKTLGPKCTIYPTVADAEKGTNPDLILAEGEGKLVLHNGSAYIRAESARFTSFLMTGAFCTLPEEAEVSGSAALLIDKPTDLTVPLKDFLDISDADDKLLGVALFYGEEPANLMGGTASVGLAGVHNGLNWKIN